MKIRPALTFAAALLAVGAPSASAHARPHSYPRTYPVASGLCERAAAGHAPKHLAADATQIAAACTALTNAYNQALSNYKAAVAPIASQVNSTLDSLRAARQAARQTHDWSTYAAAVKQAKTTLKGLRAQVRAAQQAYVQAVRAGRHTFWSTIHALPGASALPADTGTPAPPGGPVVPSGT